MDNILKWASFIFMKVLLMVKMTKNFDLYLKRAARHMLRCIYQNAIRKEYLEFPNNAKPAQKLISSFLMWKFAVFHEISRISFLENSDPYGASAPAMHKRGIHGNCYLSRKDADISRFNSGIEKNRKIIFIDPKIGLEHLVREFLNMGVLSLPADRKSL